jgi:hypothetical protein
MAIRFNVKGWVAVLVILLLLALPVLLPALQFAVAKTHRVELESLLASQLSFRQAQDVARSYEEGKAEGLSHAELAARLAGADEQMDVTLTRVQVRGDLFGRTVARVDYITADDEEAATRYFRLRYAWFTGWRLGSLREVGKGAFDGAPWR